MGGARRVRYRHLRRTVIAVLATIAFLLIFALAVRAVLEAEPTRRLARRWLVETAAGYGAELEIGDLHWGLLPPGLRLSQVTFKGAGIDAEVNALQVDLGRLWLTERTVELGRVAASGVRLSLTGLPRTAGDGQAQYKVKVRNFSLEDVTFEGVDFPGSIALDLEGVSVAVVGPYTVEQSRENLAFAREYKPLPPEKRDALLAYGKELAGRLGPRYGSV